MTITQLPDNGFALARVVLRNPASSAIAIAAALEVLDASTAPADVRLCDAVREMGRRAPPADYAVDPWAGHVNTASQINDMWARHDQIDRQNQRRVIGWIIAAAIALTLAAIAASATIERTNATVEAAQNWKG